MRRRGSGDRVDATQKAIVKTLRAVGADVLSLAPIGDGCPDLLVKYRSSLWMIEVKSPGGRLTPQQVEFCKKWPVFVVESEDDAMRIIGAIR